MVFKVEEAGEDSSQNSKVAGSKVEVDSREEMVAVAGLMVEAGTGDEAMEDMVVATEIITNIVI